MTVLGGVLLAGTDAREWSGSTFGNTLALGGAVMASGYIICGCKLRSSIPVLPYVAVCYGLSGVLLLMAAMATGETLTGYSGDTWLLLSLMVIGPTLTGHTSVNYALAYSPPVRVSLTILG